jgi:cytochrome c551/c552
MNAMKIRWMVAMPCGLALVAAMGISPARAAEPEGAKLFEQVRCYICHDTDKVSLGPPLKAIAARHAARKDIMTDVLARKIVAGGGGSWGLVPMVPNQWVSIEQARVISAWILGSK